MMDMPSNEQLMGAALIAIGGATVYQRLEPKLRELAASTKSTVDDKIVRGLGYVARLVLIVLSPLRLVPGLSAPSAAKGGADA